MRDYAKLAPTFWTGETGKALRKAGPEAVIVALYLVSSPHSNMLGLYYQPVLYMAHETGLGIEGASKGLHGCTACGFCSYDTDSEMVFVHEMARWQVADSLSEGDKRCKGLQKDYESLPANPFLGDFYDRYSGAFHLTRRRSIDGEKQEVGDLFGQGATQAPSKPHRSQEQEQEQEQERKPSASSPAKLPTCPTQSLIDLYHEVLPEMPSVRLATKDRIRALGKAWTFALQSKRPDGSRRAETAEQALTWFREYFERARQNDFLMGRTPRTGEHANWRCDLDFLLTERGMKHVIEKTLDPA